MKIIMPYRLDDTGEQFCKFKKKSEQYMLLSLSRHEWSDFIG